MGLYQLKEFLTLDDVADYLRDKGVYDFDLSQSIDRYRIHDLLKEWVFGNKLSLVFSYYGRIDVCNKTFYEDTREPIEKINLFTHNQNVVLVFNDYLLKQWANEQHLRHRFFDENVHKYSWEVTVYELFEYNYSLLDDKDHPFIILLDDCNGEYGIEPLFPKSQLDKILNAKDDSQQQISDLQAENARLQAENADLLKRITKLESQTNIAKLPYFDNSDFYTYPPELDMAIKIWYEIYQTDNLPKHFTTHSDKFTQACKNLGFKLDVTAMKERIKIVTTPQKAKEKTKNKNRQN